MLFWYHAYVPILMIYARLFAALDMVWYKLHDRCILGLRCDIYDRCMLGFGDENVMLIARCMLVCVWVWNNNIECAFNKIKT